MIAIAGAGAFGTALAVALGREGRAVTLWARDLGDMAETRRNARYLPGVDLPETVTVTADRDVFARAEVVLLAVPMQALADGSPLGSETAGRPVRCRRRPGQGQAPCSTAA